MTVRMRHTKSHTANRRSHHALKEEHLSVCPDCKAPVRRHRICSSCGKYKGRVIVDVIAKIEKKQEKAKAKAKMRGESSSTQTKEEEIEQVKDKPLNVMELSKK